MLVVSSRDFRNSQRQYLRRAKNGESVVLKSRSEGSFKIVPLSDDDTLMSKEDFFAKIERSRQQHKEGKVKRYTTEELKQIMGI